MSEWYKVKDKDAVELSEDGKMLEVLFDFNHNGNQYIEIPVEFIRPLLIAPAIDDDYDLAILELETVKQIAAENLSVSKESQNSSQNKLRRKKILSIDAAIARLKAA